MRRVRLPVLVLLVPLVGCQAAPLGPAPAAAEPVLDVRTEPATDPPSGAIEVQLGQYPAYQPAAVEVAGGADVRFFLRAQPRPAEPASLAIATHPDGVELAQSALLEQGESAVFTVRGLPPGEYRFFSRSADGFSAGFSGQLTIAPDDQPSESTTPASRPSPDSTTPASRPSPDSTTPASRPSPSHPTPSGP